MPQGADDLPLNANGPAYTSRQDRHGVPLSYVGEKLRRAIEDLHRHAQRCQGGRDDLRGAICHLLVAYLVLHNMLGKANDHTLVDRLLDGSSQNLSTWLRVVDREGDVRGLADLDDCRQASFIGGALSWGQSIADGRRACGRGQHQPEVSVPTWPLERDNQWE